MKFVALILLLGASVFSQAEILEGTAKNNKGVVVYLEKHIIEKDEEGLNKSIRVEYSTPAGVQFATMTSDFSKSKTLPETVFEDSRFKTKATIQLANGSVVFEEYKDGQSTSKKTHKFDDKMVASQGFDNFIRLNLKSLEQKPLEFKFGVLESQDFFTLTAYQKSAGGPDEKVFGIKASNWFIRVFASELKVVYVSKTLQLKSFAGRSNLLDEAGRNQDVVIDYVWKSQP